MNTRMLFQFLILPCLLFVAAASAQEETETTEAPIEVLESCELSSLVLTAPTQVLCQGDLTVAENSVILTQGHGLQIVATGRMILNEGVTITSFSDPYAEEDQDAGVVLISASNASGPLTINNYGQGAGFGGMTNLNFAAVTEDYQQYINTGFGGEVTLVVGSQQLQLDGPGHNILR